MIEITHDELVKGGKWSGAIYLMSSKEQLKDKGCTHFAISPTGAFMGKIVPLHD